MNQVEIRCSNKGSATEIRINGEAVSSFSDLATIVRLPFDKFALQLFRVLDNELFDDYSLVYYATAYQLNTIKALVPESRFCRSFVPQRMELSSLEYDVNQLLSLCRRNQVALEEIRPLGVYSEIGWPDGSFNVIQSSPEQAAVCILRESRPGCAGHIFMAGSQYGLVQNGTEIVSCFPLQDSVILFDYLKYDFILLPLFNSLQEKLTYTQLNAMDQAQFNAIMNHVPAYYLDSLPEQLDVGGSAAVCFRSFPEGEFFLRSSCPDIAGISENRLTAFTEGTAQIEVVGKDNTIKKSCSVKVIRHTYLTEIRLLPQFKYLSVNEKNQIQIISIPDRAEDVDSICWESDNPSVVQVDNRGNVTALSCGSAVVTASGKTVSASVSISVFPRLQSIALSKEKIRIRTGATQQIDCITVPENAPADGLYWTFDNPAIAACNPSKDGKSCLLTTGTQREGRGNVRCTDKNTGMSAVCPVEVSSKMGGVETLAILLIIAGIAIPFAQIVPLALGIFGIYRISVKKPIFSKKTSILAIILSIIAGVVWIMLAQ